ncbi:hypothetical protein DMZ48_08770 [Robertkochia solimangrovi]|nr:DUF5695 domain-containing protein [Robertkochia solimangrovi]TRZ43793.1 hypothetical protein DMZ48_08770 [Robertkochia solimangrovi]
MKKNKYSMFAALMVALGTCTVQAQDYWDNVKKRPSTLGLEKGYTDFEVGGLKLTLVNASQTVAGLKPLNEPTFDFTPSDRLEIRDKDTLYQLGDLNFRLRTTNGDWKSYSTSYKRGAVSPLEVKGATLAAADLTGTLPSGLPVRIERYYEKEGNHLVMRFEISNISEQEIEIGALGIPMIFNNILEGKSLDETHAQNVFFDPYIGMDAGYLEVKRLSGKGPSLLVMPEENMPFEAYRPLLDDPTRRSIVFEGFHEWMAYSKAYADSDWEGVNQWNSPSSLTLAPGESKSFSIKLVVTNGLRDIQDKLEAEDQPVAVGVPGYVLPMDVTGALYLNYGHSVKDISVVPANALTLKKSSRKIKGYTVYDVAGNTWGRARVTINYKDGKKQTVNYKVIKSESETVKDFGHFLTTEQWFDDKDDPFHRDPSVISYDYETKKQVTQDSRAWICGLSDEGGAGGWLGAIMKQLIQPDAQEIAKLEQFVDGTLWGDLQYTEGKNKWGVRKSVFFYEPDSMPAGTYSDTINYKTWAAWNKEHAGDPGRSYNYPHVAAAHWVMYRLARNYVGLVDNHSWEWYLTNAYKTTVAMVELAPYYAQFGQMEGSVFLSILEDLKHEGLTEMAEDLEKRMKVRADHWESLNYPFGSEMPWDSTGQEEVYMWSDYFGYDNKAQITLNAILAYMPVMPHWAYNGNARRYWDFLYGGKLSRVERQIHHYGSALNAIPVMKAFRNNPEDFYLLRVAYGGLLGGISNITQDGFGPAAFHSFPSTLEIDYLSGDYGSGFYGYAVNSSTVIAEDDALGIQVFGGNAVKKGKEWTIDLTTAARSKVFIAPENLWITMDAGTIRSVVYNEKTGEVNLQLNASDEYTPYAYIRTNKGELSFPSERGAYKVKLENEVKNIRIQ